MCQKTTRFVSSRVPVDLIGFKTVLFTAARVFTRRRNLFPTTQKLCDIATEESHNLRENDQRLQSTCEPQKTSLSLSLSFCLKDSLPEAISFPIAQEHSYQSSVRELSNIAHR